MYITIQTNVAWVQHRAGSSIGIAGGIYDAPVPHLYRTEIDLRARTVCRTVLKTKILVMSTQDQDSRTRTRTRTKDQGMPSADAGFFSRHGGHEAQWPNKKQQLFRDHQDLQVGVGFNRVPCLSHHPHIHTSPVHPPMKAGAQAGAGPCTQDWPSQWKRSIDKRYRLVDHVCRPCLAHATAIGNWHFTACPLHPLPCY